jgi:peptide/nickel transport system substrate-binding protein
LKKVRVFAAVLGSAAVAAFGLVACGGGSSSEGGTLTGTYSAFPDFLDPALSFTQEGWTAMYNTYLPLLTYAHANGAAGGKVVPGLAKSLPKISDSGRTYTLQLRPGLKYSNGQPVRASDFTHTLERSFKISSPGSPFYEDIVGATKFAETKSGGIPGIETDDKTGEIVIHLIQPRGTFSNELGMLFVALLPAGTPDEDLSADPPPATGPYMITKSQPGRGWEYARNPQWAKVNGKAMPDLESGHFDKIKLNVASNDSTVVNDVEQGKVDWMQAPPPPDRYPEVKAKYEGSQFRVEKTISNYYFWMNTTRPPFDDVEVRRAVNYAIDPAALERVYTGQLVANQQILPPGMPGHVKLDLYPHDLAKAKEMIAKANPADRAITVWTDNEPENQEAGEYYEDVLKKLGFETKLKVINGANYFTLLGNRATPDLDTGWVDWFEDYPNPNDFFQPLLDGESIQPNNNTNLSEMDVPELNAKIAKLGAETLGPEQEAEYAALDKAYMELAPWAPYGTRTTSTFVSSAIDLDKVIFNPTYGQDLASFESK